MATIFEKIISREIPSTIVFEDNVSIAFLDINPVMKGHTLLVPKHPYQWMQDVPDELLGQLFVRAKKIMLSMKQGLLCDYVQVVIEGIDVPHFHIKLIPSFLNRKTAEWHHESYANDSEKEEYGKTIRENLP